MYSNEVELLYLSIKMLYLYFTSTFTFTCHILYMFCACFLVDLICPCTAATANGIVF